MNASCVTMDASLLSIKFKFLIICLLCTIIFNSVMCDSKIHCNEKDMNTLLRFKQGVIDPSGVLFSWLPKLDCCQWTGVSCDNITGRVTQLNLPCHAYQPTIVTIGERDNKAHCLTGEFSLVLLELEFFIYLNLRNNDFKSIQYDSMGSQKCNNLSKGNSSHLCGNSTNLLHLDLSFNYDLLVDDLNWISRISSLQYLNLGGVLLHKEIDWLHSVTMLPSLVELHLNSCQLENIYPFLQYVNFTSLQVLDLADNNFVSYFPSWLFNLSCDISYIDLSYNQIHGQLSKTLPNLKSLKSLVLAHNYLKGPIPNWLGQLSQLQRLDLSNNFFSGPIPVTLGNLSSLVSLILNTNDLNGNLPNSVGQLSNLQSLLLAENFFTGNVSERNLLSFSKLRSFSISSPYLIFDFDPEWVPSFQLLHIYLGYVRDKLPAWLYTQSSLIDLKILDSTASFEPLDKFWKFATQLEILYLVNNTIDGDISNVLLSSKLVWLVSNNLKGGMPRISPEVVVLCIYNNSLSGSIAPLLCHNMTDKSNLVDLEMGYNHLSGELTDCWKDWKSLVHIDLEYNNLTGKIPYTMGSLSNLRFLYLASNKLFGVVPCSLKNCKNLRILDIGHNNLSGLIPSWLGSSLQGLKLRSNQFSGIIPTELCQLDSLMVMDFASNRLSGPIPNCLHNITTMFSAYASTLGVGFTFYSPNFSFDMRCTITLLIKGNELEYYTLMNAIDLSSNDLSGSVPLEIYMLNRLQSLNLSHNQLMGTIPQEIGKMEMLESIDLSRNQFTGKIPESMAGLHYLGVLNLSFNNFIGKIPPGTQLGSTNLSYIGNPGLCGPPLTKICPQDEESSNTKLIGEDDGSDKSEIYSSFYMGLGIGFAVGFLEIGTIFFNRRCRLAYFRFLSQMYDYVIQMKKALFGKQLNSHSTHIFHISRHKLKKSWRDNLTQTSYQFEKSASKMKVETQEMLNVVHLPIGLEPYLIGLMTTPTSHKVLAKSNKRLVTLKRDDWSFVLTHHRFHMPSLPLRCKIALFSSLAPLLLSNAATPHCMKPRKFAGLYLSESRSPTTGNHRTVSSLPSWVLVL
ncbi:hypothetical protein VNO78_02816 [Psophocarpus tetragonolobus]|uniref:Leucine-rich repeat-containing N-terminal plant-type domain-containing protein n=1 Tax=Psophocarpus tetragonolobus TaxID=3891 RepID=A0AAN9T0G5_PSOTE